VSELEPENESRGVGAGTGARIWRTGVGNVSRQMCRERLSGRARNRGRRGGWAQRGCEVGFGKGREQAPGQEPSNGCWHTGKEAADEHRQRVEAGVPRTDIRAGAQSRRRSRY